MSFMILSLYPVWIFKVSYSTLLYLPRLRFHCVGGCWYWTQDFFSNLSLAVRRSDPQSRQSSGARIYRSSFCKNKPIIEIERLGFVFAKTESINSGTVIRIETSPPPSLGVECVPAPLVPGTTHLRERGWAPIRMRGQTLWWSWYIFLLYFALWPSSAGFQLRKKSAKVVQLLYCHTH
jgi:hypothetical protein